MCFVHVYLINAPQMTEEDSRGEAVCGFEYNRNSTSFIVNTVVPPSPADLGVKSSQ